MKRSTQKNKMTDLLQGIKKGDLYGDDDVSTLDDIFVTIEGKKLSDWKILREVDLYGVASTNFGTVDVLKNMENFKNY